ncbi:hypothetical protein GGR52DRAFT_570337 [Hypoxylon sp. FL1284]|nr:hypothetical protein GGR52DRAFT_570337 [Hypoxylon sp. FL1284]
MHLFKPLVVAGLVACAASTHQNLGCQNCLDQSVDLINHGCRENCDKAFNPSSSEHDACYDVCQRFAFDRHCCTGTCSADPNKCMNNVFPPERKTNSRSVVDRSHARDFSSAAADPQYGAVAVRDDRTELIEARVDLGAACCKAAQAILAASVTKVVPLLQNQIWNEDALSGLILIGFGLSSATACSKVFRVSCLFQAPGVQGNVAGGILPGRNLI